MGKKIMSLVLACALVWALAAGFAFAEAQPAAAIEDDYDYHYFDDPGTGIKFRWPDVWYGALYESQCLSPAGTQYGFMFDYLAVAGQEARMKLYTDENLPADPALYTPEQLALSETIEKNTLPLVGFLMENEGERDEAMRDRFSDKRVLGEKAGTTYTLLTNPGTDLSILSDEEKAQYQALLAATAEFEHEMELTGMKGMFEDANRDGAGISFDSKDLNGEPIDASILKDYKLTMMNIWTTWCGPCVGELPELQKLSEDLPEGVNLLGICVDGEEESELAKKMQDELQLRYRNIAANQQMKDGFLSGVQSFPTTIFVDNQGKLVGKPFIGAPSGDVVETYRAAIQERLALLDQQ